MWRFLFVVVMAVALAACGNGASTGIDGEAITLDAFPSGYGRGFATAFPAEASGSKAPMKGQPAPDFFLQLDNGSHMRLTDLKGRPIMLNFWATWCHPCRLEMPDIVSESEADQDLIVLAVNVMEEHRAVESFAGDFQMTMPILMDSEGDLRNTYGVQGMPTSVFINRDGHIANVWRGLLTAEKLDELLAEIR